MADHRALRLEAATGIDVDVCVGDLCVVRAGELDLPFRRGQLLAARAGVLQGSHFGRVAERRERGRREEGDRGRQERKEVMRKWGEIKKIAESTKKI